MKVTLLRTGGIIAILKKATREVDFSEKEMNELIDAIRVESDNQGKMRDNTVHQLIFNDQTVSVNLEKVPQKYKKTFDSLKDNLQIVKQG